MALSVLSLSGAGDRKSFIRAFIDYPKTLYENDPHWLPWFDVDMREILFKRHPFFRHSDGEFFICREDGKTAGRICVVENTRYGEHHGKKVAHFFFFDFPDNADIAGLLTREAAEWAGARGLDTIEGPMLFGGMYGTGVLVQGFDSPPPMTMMPYNYPYYDSRLTQAGFTKWIDLYSARLDPKNFSLPEKITRVAELVKKRSNLRVLRFTNKGQLRRISVSVGEIINAALAHHPEDYPITREELTRIAKDIISVARPDLLKVLADGERSVGFLFAFPDASAAIRANKGKVTPLGILRLLASLKREERLIINGMGILPEYQGRGGNALLYAELLDTLRSSGFREAELVQVAETTDLMLKDMRSLGAEITKTYRMYTMAL